MLPCETAILVAVDAAGCVGRTALQKIIFFAKEAGLTEADYKPHYYGPYSREVAANLLSLVAAGWIQEISEAWPNGSVFGERHRYTYRLTPTGQDALKKLVEGNDSAAEALRKIVRLCQQKTGLDFQMLSWAAKIHFLSNKRRELHSASDVAQEARKWGWEVREEDVPKVAGLLEELQSVKPSC
jgi:uncharacterized protein YwgA